MPFNLDSVGFEKDIADSNPTESVTMHELFLKMGHAFHQLKGGGIGDEDAADLHAVIEDCMERICTAIRTGTSGEPIRVKSLLNIFLPLFTIGNLISIKVCSLVVYSHVVLGAGIPLSELLRSVAQPNDFKDIIEVRSVIALLVRQRILIAAEKTPATASSRCNPEIYASNRLLLAVFGHEFSTSIRSEKEHVGKDDAAQKEDEHSTPTPTKKTAVIPEPLKGLIYPKRLEKELAQFVIGSESAVKTLACRTAIHLRRIKLLNEGSLFFMLFIILQ